MEKDMQGRSGKKGLSPKKNSSPKKDLSIATHSCQTEAIHYYPYRWCIHYYPNGSSLESKDHISFFLNVDQSVRAKAVNACFQIRFVNNVNEKTFELGRVLSFASNSGKGFSTFIKREGFEKSKHLKDDSFAVRCDIAVINEFRIGMEAEKADVVDMPALVSVPPSSLHQDLADLLLTEKGADVVFEVGGETFAAHRCVLAARSPVFNAELLGTMKESDTAGAVRNYFRIDDMEAHVFKALLCYVYTDAMPETTKTENEQDVMPQHLLIAADRYNLERLKLMCEEKLCTYIDGATVETLLALADQHQCRELKKACFGFLKSPEDLKAVMSSDSVKHLSRSCPAIMVELVQ
ncbi:hypothetical protein EJB05_22751, partial [Eragrostis curvula]